MTIKQKENAEKRIRIFETTHKRLKIRAAREGKSIGQLVDELERKNS